MATAPFVHPTSCMRDPMLDLYTSHTPNGRTPAILLAELELPYDLHLVHVARGEHAPDDADANPNGNVPTLIDRDPVLGRVVTFESGVILQYLADKYRRFLPLQLGGRRADVLSWLGWQMSSAGPLFERLDEFANHKPRDQYAFELFFREARRLGVVLDRRLVDRNFIADEYSIADIACYSVFAAIADAFPSALDGTRELHRWLRRIGHRPAVKLGMRFERLAQAA